MVQTKFLQWQLGQLVAFLLLLLQSVLKTERVGKKEACKRILNSLRLVQNDFQNTPYTTCFVVLWSSLSSLFPIPENAETRSVKLVSLPNWLSVHQLECAHKRAGPNLQHLVWIYRGASILLSKDWAAKTLVLGVFPFLAGLCTQKRKKKKKKENFLWRNFLVKRTKREEEEEEEEEEERKGPKGKSRISRQGEENT